MMHRGKKSDCVIVRGKSPKSPKKAGRRVSEAMEYGRSPRKTREACKRAGFSQVIRRRAPIENRNGLGYPADADFQHGMDC
jgi:hypothetical protein